MYNFEVWPIILFMWIGMIASVLSLFVGVPWLISWLYHHVQFV